MKKSKGPQGVKRYLDARRQKKRWQMAVVFLACVVVFGTIYALILPAITLGKDQKLECSYEVHHHTADCYDEEGTLVCGFADYVVHEHDDSCYDEDGVLVCPLEELEVHEHGDSCYEEKRVLDCGLEEGEDGHQHDDSCYKTEKELICKKPEVILHTHGEDCYDEGGNVICGLLQVEEHVHDENCLSQEEETAGDTSEEENTLNTSEENNTQNTSEEGSTQDSSDNEEISLMNLEDEEDVDKEDGDNAAANTPVAYTELSDALEDLEKELIEKYGIYLGSQSTDQEGNEVWTAMDGAEESSAKIKATVTLPSGTKAAENTYLYIRKVNGADGETAADGFYPDSTALSKAVGDSGEYGDVQCYAIHWVRFYTDENGQWKYEVQTSSVLDDDNYAKIAIDYLDPSARLKGDPESHALQIFNSRKEDGTILEETNVTPTGISVSGDSYTGFTFKTNRAGPYVFVSKKLEYTGYVSKVAVASILDGTAPWDSTDGNGGDTGQSNSVVRTFDTVQYALDISIASTSDSFSDTTGTVGFEFTVKKDPIQATFDFEAMSWLKDTGSAYSIDYLDKDGNRILYLDEDGNLCKTDGTITSINAMATGGGESSGKDCYRCSDVAVQRLRGTYRIEGDTVITSSTTRLTCGVKVLNDLNEETIAPEFKVWMEGNEANYGYTGGGGDGSVADKLKVAVDNTATASDVTISAGAMFNTEVKKHSFLGYRSWFDFSKGIELTDTTTTQYTIGNTTVTGAQLYKLLEVLGTLLENRGKANPSEYTDQDNVCSSYLAEGLTLADYASILSEIRYGRMYGYGIGVQLANTDASGDKGMKGLNLPYGEISLDLLFTTSATSADSGVTSEDLSEYTAVLWDYNENVHGGTITTYRYADGRTIIPITTATRYLGNMGRTLRLGEQGFSHYAYLIEPYNYGGENATENQAYDGGSWDLTNGSISANTPEDTLYHFTIKDYDFNLNDYTFPTKAATSSNTTARYVNYEYTISTGFAQVLNVMPRTAKGTIDINLNVQTGNLSVTTVSDQSISKDNSKNPENTICYDYETNTAGKDNLLNSGVTAYSPGTVSRSNSYIKRSGTYLNDQFLGANPSAVSYDATAYVGSKFAIIGSIRIESTSDYNMRAMNYLQLFDSHAIRVDEDLSEGADQTDKITSLYIDNGEITILFAADPDYPGGYNTNGDNKKADGTMTSGEEMMVYMNTVRDDDLIYFASVDALEEAGYTCIGVLQEVRNCDVKNGITARLRIPVTVNDAEGVVGNTVATVNAAKIWTTGGAMTDTEGKSISWLNGVWDETTGKNILEGYQPIVGLGSDGTGNGYDVNNGTGSKGYIKVEYENGIKVSGDQGGNAYGNSLLVLGYKARLAIDVEKDTYGLNGGSTDATFTLNTIQAEIEDDQISQLGQATDLLLTVDLTARHYKETSDYSDPDVNLINGTYQMKVEKEDGTTEMVTISMDSNNPTEVTFYSGGKNYTFSVYAKPDLDGKKVLFTLKDAPIGVNLPDISFKATLGSGLLNNDTITATATITGSGDCREYSEIGGNLSSVSVNVYTLGGTALTKSVDGILTELDGTLTYKVKYSNTSTTDPIMTSYFYDIIPYNGDARGSNYKDTEATDDTILTGINFESFKLGTNTPTNDFQANVTIYYSTLSEKMLYTLLSGFNGSEDSAEDLANAAAVEKMLEEDSGYFHELGTMEKVTDGDGNTTAQYVRKAAVDLGYADYVDGKLVWISEEKEAEYKKNFLPTINAIFVKVENMGANRDIVMTLTMETNHNEAGNIYGNTAWAWIANSATQPLRSEIVQTVAISREISGAVWHDSNLNGLKDEDEPKLSGVNCTLFKKNEQTGSYEICQGDVTGAGIGQETENGYDGTVQTDENGAYTFSKLAAGEYVVAFSGEKLDIYNGATTYQVKKENDDDSNDGVALKKTESRMDQEEIVFAGIDESKYSYAIAYSLSDKNEAETLSLHTLDKYLSKSDLLTDYQENFVNQNLGLVIAGYELPETGGTGAAPYTIIGLLLMAGAVIYGCKRKSKTNG